MWKLKSESVSIRNMRTRAFRHNPSSQCQHQQASSQYKCTWIPVSCWACTPSPAQHPLYPCILPVSLVVSASTHIFLPLAVALLILNCWESVSIIIIKRANMLKDKYCLQRFVTWADLQDLLIGERRKLLQTETCVTFTQENLWLALGHKGERQRTLPVPVAFSLK